MTASTSVLAVQYVRVIATQLEAMGVAVAAWLSRSGLSHAALRDDEFTLELPVFRKLALDALACCGDPALGVRIGERLGVQAHGVLGHAAVSSSTPREMLAVIERYLALRIALVGLRVEDRGEETRVVFYERVPLQDIRAVVLEAVVGAVKTMLDDVSMGACRVSNVSFEQAEPAHAAVARALLGARVRYGQDWTGFALPTALLPTRLKLSDPASFRLAEALCQRQLERLKAAASWSDRVRRVLLQQRHGFPGQEATAKALHVSRRTLHRHLVREGTSFRAVLDGVRHGLAVEHLQQGAASIEEIAYLLGYSDPANFRRAFKRWTGVPPSSVRSLS